MLVLIENLSFSRYGILLHFSCSENEILSDLEAHCAFYGYPALCKNLNLNFKLEKTAEPAQTHTIVLQRGPLD